MSAPSAPQILVPARAPAPALPASLSELTPGARVNLRLSSRGTDRRVAARLDELHVGTHLIVRLEDPGALAVPLSVGDAVYARCLGGRMAFGFATRIVHIVHGPCTQVQLAYPDTVESVALRNAERVPVALRAFAIGETGERLPVDVRDLSETGALVFVDAPTLRIGDEFRLSIEITLASAHHPLDVPCVVRNVRAALAVGEAQPPYRVGVQFSVLSEEATRMLRAFVHARRPAGVTPFEV